MLVCGQHTAGTQVLATELTIAQAAYDPPPAGEENGNLPGLMAATP